MAEINVWGSLAEGAAAGQKYKETLAEPEILKQAYAGVSPQEAAADPSKQQSIYAQAAAMAGSRGMNQLAYNFQKQATELNSAAQLKQLNDLKIKDAEVSFANQLLTGAQSNEDLEAAINSTVKDDAIKMRLLGQVRNPDMSFDTKKKALMDMTMTAKERLDAQRVVLEGQRVDEQKRHDLQLERQNEATLAQRQQQHAETIAETQRARYDSELKTFLAQGIYPEDPSFPAYLRDYLKTGKTEYQRKNEAKTSQDQRISGEKEARAAGIPVISGDRDFAKQSALYEKSQQPGYKGPPVAKPGTSRHETGDALDVDRNKLTPENRKWLTDNGYYQPLPKTDPNHWQRARAGEEAPAAGADTAFKPMSLDEMYAKKRGGGLTPKDWDSINPTAVNIGKEYKVNPMALTNASNEEKKQATTSYQVTKMAEDTADYVKAHPRAVGTLAAIIKKAEGMEGDLLDNISKDKRYTGEVQEMGKRLMTLGLKDAGSAGRMNVYLEKTFSNFYRQSQTPETLLRIIKARQDESFQNLESIYSADRNNLDKSKYKLAFANSAEEFLGKQAGTAPAASRTTTTPGAGGSRTSGMAANERPPLSSFQR